METGPTDICNSLFPFCTQRRSDVRCAEVTPGHITLCQDFPHGSLLGATVLKLPCKRRHFQGSENSHHQPNAPSSWLGWHPRKEVGRTREHFKRGSRRDLEMPALPTRSGEWHSADTALPAEKMLTEKLA